MVFGIGLVVALGIVSAYFFGFTQPSPRRAAVKIGDREFAAEVADTPARRAKGLSGRASLPENEGMLFVFEEPGNHGFWMKDMKFAIDIIWIKGDKIVGLTENAEPEPQKSVLGLTVYYPPEPVDKVLEINYY